MAELHEHVDKKYEDKSFDEIADAPVEALRGLSKEHAKALEKDLKITTIRELATSPFVLRAQAFVALAHAHRQDQAR